MDNGPSAQRLTPCLSVVRSIVAQQDEVWNVISAPGHLELVHPFCESNVVVEWPGETSIDQIRYRSGNGYDRRFTRWIDGVGYDLEIGAVNEPTRKFPEAGTAKDGITDLTISLWPRAVVDIPGLRGFGPLGDRWANDAPIPALGHCRSGLVRNPSNPSAG